MSGAGAPSMMGGVKRREMGRSCSVVVQLDGLSDRARAVFVVGGGSQVPPLHVEG